MGRRSTDSRAILAIDIGTSSLRAATVDESGCLLAVERRPQALRQPAEAGEFAVEFDIDQTRASLMDAAACAISRSGADAPSIAAIAVTSQRQGIVLLGRDNETLYAGPNTDMRGVFSGAEMDEAHGDLIWDSCAHSPAYLLAWPRLKWFQKQQPELFEQARYAATLADWAVLQLSGELAIHHTSGVEAGLLTLESAEPASCIAKAVGLESIGTPSVITSQEAAGSLLPDVAEALGIRGGIPVVNAGADTQAGLVGMDVVTPGATGVVAGWSCAVQRVTDRTMRDPQRVLWCGRHAVGGFWILECNTGIMGGAYSWLAGLVAGSDKVDAVMRRFDREAAMSAAGTTSVSAHLGPALVNIGTQGMRTGGFVFPVPMALTPPEPGAVARAALESFCFAIRAGVEGVDRVAGSDSASVSIGGGMTRSTTFTDILPSVLGREVIVGGADASLSGAALMAGRLVGAGRSNGHSGRTNGAIRHPVATLASEYADLYEQWSARSAALDGIPV